MTLTEANTQTFDAKAMLALAKQAYPNYVEEFGGKDYRYHHCARVLTLTQKLLQTQEIRQQEVNADAACIAALFHDVGTEESGCIENGFFSYQTHFHLYANHHVPESAKKMRALLTGQFSEETLDLAEQAIWEHGVKEPASVEGKICYDTDKLDGHSGPAFVWRIFTLAAYRKQTVQEAYADYLQHGQHRVENLANEMHFETTKAWAKTRTQQVIDYFSDLGAQLQGEVPPCS